MLNRGGSWYRGAAAGILGASVLAVWFLFVDVVSGDPFDTLRTATGLAFGQQQVGTIAMVFYTLVHFGALAGVGVVLATACEKAGIPLFPFLGPVAGFFLFDLAFYAAVIVRGSDIVGLIGWPQMLAGNVLAGTALVATLRRSTDPGSASWREVFRSSPTLRSGVATGLAGAAAVMLWFLGIDLLNGNPLWTPGALGSALFYGARGSEQVRIDVQTVAGYTGLHLALFLAAGIAAAAIARLVRRNPPVLLGIALGFITLQALFTGLIAALASWTLDAVSWWSIAVANLLAVLVMGGVLAARNPELRRAMATINLERDAAGTPR